MSWSNVDHAYFDDNMDSVGRQLTVKSRLTGENQTPDDWMVWAEFPIRPGTVNLPGKALKVNGETKVSRTMPEGEQEVEYHCGTIVGEVVYEQEIGHGKLLINAGNYLDVPPNGDPDIKIGWHRTGPPEGGNNVYIGGKEIAIGHNLSPSTGYPVTMLAPVKLQATEEVTALTTGGKIHSPEFDAPLGGSGVLAIAPDNTEQLNIGPVDEPDRSITATLKGTLDVTGATTIENNLTVINQQGQPPAAMDRLIRLHEGRIEERL